MPEYVPQKAFLWIYRGNVYPKRRFWVHVGMAGVDGVKPPFADLESAVLLTELNSYGGTNGYRTHDLLRDRQAF